MGGDDSVAEDLGAMGGEVKFPDLVAEIVGEVWEEVEGCVRCGLRLGLHI